GVLELDERVWSRHQSPEWFRWKYVANPFVDHVPIVVAEYDGTIVGIRPFMAFELRSDDVVRTAFQPADTAVHPDHRRNGIFQRMTRLALDRYADGEPALFFNFPNQYARGGYESLGWRMVSPAVTHFLPRSTAGYANGSLVWRGGSLLIDPILNRRQRYKTARVSVPEAVSIRRLEGVPYDRLAELYRRNVPSAFHAHRSEQFLRWRLSSPSWHRRTYLAGYDGSTVGLVTRTRRLDNDTVLTQLVDVFPFEGGARWTSATKTALRAAIEDHPETDLFSTVGETIPERIRAQFGFLSNERLPLSSFTRYETALVTRPNTDPDRDTAWQIGGISIDSPDHWRQTFIEWDTS
ncbi:MAG: GNAT family N-acetyltransferase, partial [Halobacteriota archaeon]